MTLTPKMLEACRGVMGLETDDSSRDAEILKWSPVRVVRACSQWEMGDPGWADIFALWMERAGADPADFRN